MYMYVCIYVQIIITHNYDDFSLLLYSLGKRDLQEQEASFLQITKKIINR